MTWNRRRPRPIAGYEILGRIVPVEVLDQPLDSRRGCAVLGARGRRYLVPPDVDIFELGVIDVPGLYELLPIDGDLEPLWDNVIPLVVTQIQARRQRDLLLRAYRTLREMIVTADADALDANVAAWSRCGAPHPIFGLLCHAAIEVWSSIRPAGGALTNRQIDVLHAEVARRVATRIRARLLGY